MGNSARKRQKKSLYEILDNYIFIKNGYSLIAHILPFSVASLLLIILSVPKDNLLLQLAEVLISPSFVWIPAILLTLVALFVYLLSIHEQIRKAYLWNERICLRTIMTSLSFIVLCTSMALSVMFMALDRAINFIDLWACFLISILSLTGIGWQGPSKWVDSIGIKIPDYSTGRSFVNQIADILLHVRKKPGADIQDVDDFLNAFAKLQKNIEENLDFEPDWEEKKLTEVKDTIRSLIRSVKQNFKDADEQTIMAFSAACRGEMSFRYGEITDNLDKLSSFWKSWKQNP